MLLPQANGSVGNALSVFAAAHAHLRIGRPASGPGPPPRVQVPHGHCGVCWEPLGDTPAGCGGAAPGSVVACADCGQTAHAVCYGLLVPPGDGGSGTDQVPPKAGPGPLGTGSSARQSQAPGPQLARVESPSASESKSNGGANGSNEVVSGGGVGGGSGSGGSCRGSESTFFPVASGSLEKSLEKPLDRPSSGREAERRRHLCGGCRWMRARGFPRFQPALQYLHCALCGRSGGLLSVCDSGTMFAHLACLYFAGLQDPHLILGGKPAGVERAISLHRHRRLRCASCGSGSGYSQGCSFPGCDRRVHAMCALAARPSVTEQPRPTPVPAVRAVAASFASGPGPTGTGPGPLGAGHAPAGTAGAAPASPPSTPVVLKLLNCGAHPDTTETWTAMRDFQLELLAIFQEVLVASAVIARKSREGPPRGGPGAHASAPGAAPLVPGRPGGFVDVYGAPHPGGGNHFSYTSGGRWGRTGPGPEASGPGPPRDGPKRRLLAPGALGGRAFSASTAAGASRGGRQVSMRRPVPEISRAGSRVERVSSDYGMSDNEGGDSSVVSNGNPRIRGSRRRSRTPAGCGGTSSQEDSVEDQQKQRYVGAHVISKGIKLKWSRYEAFLRRQPLVPAAIPCDRSAALARVLHEVPLPAGSVNATPAQISSLVSKHLAPLLLAPANGAALPEKEGAVADAVRLISGATPGPPDLMGLVTGVVTAARDAATATPQYLVEALFDTRRVHADGAAGNLDHFLLLLRGTAKHALKAEGHGDDVGASASSAGATRAAGDVPTLEHSPRSPVLERLAKAVARLQVHLDTNPRPGAVRAAFVAECKRNFDLRTLLFAATAVAGAPTVPDLESWRGTSSTVHAFLLGGAAEVADLERSRGLAAVLACARRLLQAARRVQTRPLTCFPARFFLERARKADLTRRSSEESSLGSAAGGTSDRSLLVQLKLPPLAVTAAPPGSRFPLSIQSVWRSSHDCLVQRAAADPADQVRKGSGTFYPGGSPTFGSGFFERSNILGDERHLGDVSSQDAPCKLRASAADGSVCVTVDGAPRPVGPGHAPAAGASGSFRGLLWRVSSDSSLDLGGSRGLVHAGVLASLGESGPESFVARQAAFYGSLALAIGPKLEQVRSRFACRLRADAALPTRITDAPHGVQTAVHDAVQMVSAWSRISAHFVWGFRDHRDTEFVIVDTAAPAQGLSPAVEKRGKHASTPALPEPLAAALDDFGREKRTASHPRAADAPGGRLCAPAMPYSLDLRSKLEGPDPARAHIRALPAGAEAAKPLAPPWAVSAGARQRTCAVCFGPEWDGVNAVLSCSQCRVMVHRHCYGVTNTTLDAETDNWQCRRCAERATSARCRLCNTRGGALARAEQHQWVHVNCAVFLMPETVALDLAALDRWRLAGVQSWRWRAACSICAAGPLSPGKPGSPAGFERSSSGLSDFRAVDSYPPRLASAPPHLPVLSLTANQRGVCVKCAHPACDKTFHIMCAWFAGLQFSVERRADLFRATPWSRASADRGYLPALDSRIYCPYHTRAALLQAQLPLPSEASGDNLVRSTGYQRCLRVRRYVNRDLYPHLCRGPGPPGDAPVHCSAVLLSSESAAHERDRRLFALFRSRLAAAAARELLLAAAKVKLLGPVRTLERNDGLSAAQERVTDEINGDAPENPKIVPKGETGAVHYRAPSSLKDAPNLGLEDASNLGYAAPVVSYSPGDRLLRRTLKQSMHEAHLESDATALNKYLPFPDKYVDSLCAVCFCRETDAAPLFRCRRCAIPVHPSCYLAERDYDSSRAGTSSDLSSEELTFWQQSAAVTAQSFTCDVCTACRPIDDVPCFLCPRRGGALRLVQKTAPESSSDGPGAAVPDDVKENSPATPLRSQRGTFAAPSAGEAPPSAPSVTFVHAQCLAFVPGRLSPPDLADLVRSPLYSQWTCSVCDHRHGVALPCSKPGCSEFLHPLCAKLDGCFVEKRVERTARSESQDDVFAPDPVDLGLISSDVDYSSDVPASSVVLYCRQHSRSLLAEQEPPPLLEAGVQLKIALERTREAVAALFSRLSSKSVERERFLDLLRLERPLLDQAQARYGCVLLGEALQPMEAEGKGSSKRDPVSRGGTPFVPIQRGSSSDVERRPTELVQSRDWTCLSEELAKTLLRPVSAAPMARFETSRSLEQVLRQSSGLLLREASAEVPSRPGDAPPKAEAREAPPTGRVARASRLERFRTSSAANLRDVGSVLERELTRIPPLCDLSLEQLLSLGRSRTLSRVEMAQLASFLYPEFACRKRGRPSARERVVRMIAAGTLEVFRRAPENIVSNLPQAAFWRDVETLATQCPGRDAQNVLCAIAVRQPRSLGDSTTALAAAAAAAGPAAAAVAAAHHKYLAHSNSSDFFGTGGRPPPPPNQALPHRDFSPETAAMRVAAGSGRPLVDGPAGKLAAREGGPRDVARESLVAGNALSDDAPPLEAQDDADDDEAPLAVAHAGAAREFRRNERFAVSSTSQESSEAPNLERGPSDRSSSTEDIVCMRRGSQDILPPQEAKAADSGDLDPDYVDGVNADFERASDGFLEPVLLSGEPLLQDSSDSASSDSLDDDEDDGSQDGSAESLGVAFAHEKSQAFFKRNRSGVGGKGLPPFERRDHASMRRRAGAYGDRSTVAGARSGSLPHFAAETPHSRHGSESREGSPNSTSSTARRSAMTGTARTLASRSPRLLSWRSPSVGAVTWRPPDAFLLCADLLLLSVSLSPQPRLDQVRLVARRPGSSDEPLASPGNPLGGVPELVPVSPCLPWDVATAEVKRGLVASGALSKRALVKAKSDKKSFSKTLDNEADKLLIAASLFVFCWGARAATAAPPPVVKGLQILDKAKCLLDHDFRPVSASVFQNPAASQAYRMLYRRVLREDLRPADLPTAFLAAIGEDPAALNAIRPGTPLSPSLEMGAFMRRAAEAPLDDPVDFSVAYAYDHLPEGWTGDRRFEAFAVGQKVRVARQDTAGPVLWVEAVVVFFEVVAPSQSVGDEGAALCADPQIYGGGAAGLMTFGSGTGPGEKASLDAAAIVLRGRYLLFYESDKSLGWNADFRIGPVALLFEKHNATHLEKLMEVDWKAQLRARLLLAGGSEARCQRCQVPLLEEQSPRQRRSRRPQLLVSSKLRPSGPGGRSAPPPEFIQCRHLIRSGSGLHEVCEEARMHGFPGVERRYAVLQCAACVCKNCAGSPREWGSQQRNPLWRCEACAMSAPDGCAVGVARLVAAAAAGAVSRWASPDPPPAAALAPAETPAGAAEPGEAAAEPQAAGNAGDAAAGAAPADDLASSSQDVEVVSEADEGDSATGGAGGADAGGTAAGATSADSDMESGGGGAGGPPASGAASGAAAGAAEELSSAEEASTDSGDSDANAEPAFESASSGSAASSDESSSAGSGRRGRWRRRPAGAPAPPSRKRRILASDAPCAMMPPRKHQAVGRRRRGPACRSRA